MAPVDAQERGRRLHRRRRAGRPASPVSRAQHRRHRPRHPLLGPLALNRRARLLIAPFSLVFLVANLIKFQPWDWDNSKLLVFWYLASAVAVGAMLIRTWRATLAGTVGAAIMWVTLVAAGGL